MDDEPRYRIARAGSIAALEDAVNAMVDSGYEPHGSITVVVQRSGEPMYLQPMMSYEP